MPQVSTRGPQFTRPETSVELLASLVQGSDDAIVSASLDGEITSWNDAAERLFGFSAAHAIGKPAATLLADPSNPDEMRDAVAAIRAGKRVQHYEALRQHKDGRTMYVSLSVSPIRM